MSSRQAGQSPCKNRSRTRGAGRQIEESWWRSLPAGRDEQAVRILILTRLVSHENGRRSF